LTAHAAEIDATPNLIIDLRNNGGGSDFVYEPLIPLLYTRPIYTISIEMRASPDNLAQRQALANQLRAEAPEVAAELDNQNKTMAANIGRYFSPDTASFGIDRRAGVARSPKRVGVILDYAASSGEQFLLMARQSRKVTLFGQHNSAGILDFANVVGMTSPSGRFALAWPTSRSLRLPDDPVDPDGIAPDVRIPRDVSDPVLYVKSWLERQAD
jgi:C-terminal processing protease CtpA/Prc